MRLIDADDFMERMECDTDICAEMEQDGLKALKKYLDLQPTAYDVDKVVEQLEELKSEKDIGSHKVMIKEAIDIVKADHPIEKCTLQWLQQKAR